MHLWPAGRQYAPADRNVRGVETFTGVHTYAGRHDGQDSLAASKAAVQGKVQPPLLPLPESLLADAKPADCWGDRHPSNI